MNQLLVRLTALLLPVCTYAQEYAVGERTISLTDSIRNRPVTVELWYPTNETDPKAEPRTALLFLLPPLSGMPVLLSRKPRSS